MSLDTAFEFLCFVEQRIPYGKHHGFEHTCPDFVLFYASKMSRNVFFSLQRQHFN